MNARSPLPVAPRSSKRRLARAALLASLLGGVSSVAACSAGDSTTPASGHDSLTTQLSARSMRDSAKTSLPRRVFRYLPGDAHAAAIQASEQVVAERDREGRYPAFVPDVPQLVENGGPTLRFPHVVSITWDGDPAQSEIESFGDRLGWSSYWHAAVGEYGVEGAWSSPHSHVHLSPLPTTAVPFDQVMRTVHDSVANAATSGWPAWGPETIYTVYMPPDIGVSFDGFDICSSGVGGWHEDIALDPAVDGGADAGPGRRLLYAIIFRCPTRDTPQDATFIASHELAESATDPFPNTHLALGGYDPDHLAYEFTQQYNDENGDACEFFKSSRDVETEPFFSFTVQRPWSNRSARRGHNPCVPRTADAYFNVTPFPSQLDDVTLDLTTLGGTTGTKTKGYKVALGASKTFDIGFFSDRPAADWTLSAVVNASPGWSHLGYLTDNAGNPLDNGAINVTIDAPTGGNGHVAHVTVTPTRTGTVGGEWIVLRSLAAGVASDPARPMPNDLPIFVAQQ